QYFVKQNINSSTEEPRRKRVQTMGQRFNSLNQMNQYRYEAKVENPRHDWNAYEHNQNYDSSNEVDALNTKQQKSLSEVSGNNLFHQSQQLNQNILIPHYEPTEKESSKVNAAINSCAHKDYSSCFMCAMIKHFVVLCPCCNSAIDLSNMISKDILNHQLINSAHQNAAPDHHFKSDEELSRESFDRVNISGPKTKHIPFNQLNYSHQNFVPNNGDFHNQNPVFHDKMMQNDMIQPTAVVMVYNINGNIINCQHLYNLFSLYADVNKVKFLKTLESSNKSAAMVEVTSKSGADNIINYLDEITAFGQALHIHHSKQNNIDIRSKSYILPDSTESQQSFMSQGETKKFSNPNAQRRLNIPNKTLHVSYLPNNMTTEDLKNLIFTPETPKPHRMKTIGKAERKTALIEFENIPKAVECMMLCNLKNINNTRFPTFRTVRLDFAVSDIRDE
ncbi:MAG: hypothetical protein MHPSP_001677, partial [Paramarteilia canceri]